MKQFQVIARQLTLNSGQVRLSEQQAAVRQHCLKKVGNGVYEITGECNFKAGERLEYDGDLPKGLATSMVSPEAAEGVNRRAAQALGDAVYADAAVDIVGKRMTLEYASTGIARHYGAPEKQVRAELRKRAAAFEKDADALAKAKEAAKQRGRE